MSISVVDAGANLTSAALVTLGGDSDVQSIAVTGVVSFTEAQFVTGGDLQGLAKIAGAWSVAVSSASVAEVSAVESAFSALGNAGASSLTTAVADAAANIDSAALAALGADSDVQSISVTSGILSLTEAQFGASADQLGLAKIASYSVELTQVVAADAAELTDTAHVSVLQVGDTASDIQASLDALNNNNQVVSIVISDSAPLAITAYAATQDSRAIGLLQNLSGGSVSLTVSDTAANIALYFDQLDTETNVSSIVISDNASLTLSAAQIADSGTIAKLSNADSSGVVIDVSDTAAHISADLSSIENDTDNLGYVSQVAISDNTSITVSLAQRTSDQTALGLLQNADGAAVDLIVDDTAENILDNSASLAQDGEVRQVLISDNAALHLTVAQVSKRRGSVHEARGRRQYALRRRHRG